MPVSSTRFGRCTGYLPAVAARRSTVTAGYQQELPRRSAAVPLGVRSHGAKSLDQSDDCFASRRM